jgi:hypothetical protein
MESHSERNKIHMSDEAAKRVMEQDRSLAVQKRRPAVDVKGVGRMTTYWLLPDGKGADEDVRSLKPLVNFGSRRATGEGSMTGRRRTTHASESVVVNLDAIVEYDPDGTVLGGDTSSV